MESVGEFHIESDRPLTYRYPLVDRALYYSLVPISLIGYPLIGLSVWFFSGRVSIDWEQVITITPVWAKILMAGTWIIGGAGSILNVFWHPTIFIQNNSISAYVLGFRWRTLKIDEIRELDKVLDEEPNRPHVSCHIVVGGGKIRVTARIIGYDELKKKLNALATKHNIPIYLLSRYSTPENNLGWWQRVARRVRGQKISIPEL